MLIGSDLYPYLMKNGRYICELRWCACVEAIHVCAYIKVINQGKV